VSCYKHVLFFNVSCYFYRRVCCFCVA